MIISSFLSYFFLPVFRSSFLSSFIPSSLYSIMSSLRSLCLSFCLDVLMSSMVCLCINLLIYRFSHELIYVVFLPLSNSSGVLPFPNVLPLFLNHQCSLSVLSVFLSLLCVAFFLPFHYIVLPFLSLFLYAVAHLALPFCLLHRLYSLLPVARSFFLSSFLHSFLSPMFLCLFLSPALPSFRSHFIPSVIPPRRSSVDLFSVRLPCILSLLFSSVRPFFTSPLISLFIYVFISATLSLFRYFCPPSYISLFLVCGLPSVLHLCLPSVWYFFRSFFVCKFMSSLPCLFIACCLPFVRSFFLPLCIPVCLYFFTVCLHVFISLCLPCFTNLFCVPVLPHCLPSFLSFSLPSLLFHPFFRYPGLPFSLYVVIRSSFRTSCLS